MEPMQASRQASSHVQGLYQTHLVDDMSASAPIQSGATAMTLTEYEQQRLQHIQRNQEFMARLGLPSLVPGLSPEESKPKAAPKARRRVQAADKERVEPTRRSARVKQEAPLFTGAEIDNLSEDDVEESASRKRTKRQPDATDEERAAEMRAVLEDSRLWLQSSRDALLKVGKVEGQAPSTSNEWRDEAIRRWGPKVKDVTVPDWEVYVMSRLSKPPSPSSLDLLQEYYAHDCWQLLICCVLMSRVSSHNVKHNTIAAFFRRYPTPSAALDADPDDVLGIIAPLGLFPGRMRSIVEVTAAFLKTPQFFVGLEKEFKIYGIGEFGVDSFNIFCRGEISCNPNDRCLKSFCDWQKRHNNKNK